jgi:hypothetical protein
VKAPEKLGLGAVIPKDVFSADGCGLRTIVNIKLGV